MEMTSRQEQAFMTVGILGGVATSTYLTYLYMDAGVNDEKRRSDIRGKWVATDYIFLVFLGALTAVPGTLVGAMVGMGASAGVSALMGKGDNRLP